MVRIRLSLYVAGSLNLLLSWRLPRRVGCVGGIGSGCIRVLGYRAPQEVVDDALVAVV